MKHYSFQRLVGAFLAVCAPFFIVLFFVYFRNSFSQAAHNFRVSFFHLFSRSDIVSRIVYLEGENEKLRITNDGLERQILPDRRFNEITASVFSYYPWNGRATIIVNKGEADGVRVGMPVLTEFGILLGRVSQVTRTRSEVITIFDPTWKSSVSVGPRGVKGLLQGGATPKVDLIPVDAVVSSADSVLSVSPDFPLYAPVGIVSRVAYTAGSSWQQAELSSAYRFEDISAVRIVIDFP